jgi:para-nitrobenzyl esterase
LSSPLTKGLIQRAIEESGTVMIGGDVTPPRSKLEAAGVQLAAKWKAPPTGQIKYLRTLSTADILKGSPPYAQRGPLRPEPDIDGYAIVTQPAQVFKEHGELPVPLIIGNNGREMTLAGGPEALKRAIAGRYKDRASEAMKVYGLDGPNPDTYLPHGDGNSQWVTDNMFRCGSVVIANWHSARFPTWEYEFTRAPEPHGAVHSWELQYVFGNLLKEAGEPADRALSDQVMTYWTNFAKTGNPNGGSLLNWVRHDSMTAAYIDFASGGPVMREGLRKEACKLFEQNLPLSQE